MPAISTWTDARVQMLVRLWLEGHSASQIARRLAGGATRNAVLGKVHRLGLSGRARQAPAAALKAPAAARGRGQAAYAALRKRPVVRAPPAAAATAERPGTASILTVGRHSCRWPIGDPLAEGFTLCGRAAAWGAYCGAHGARAYRAVDKDHLMALAGLA